MSFNQKALRAFKKLGVAVLITAITLTFAMCFTACKQTGNTGGGGGKPKPKPRLKHAVTFSVDGANGTLKAKAEGEATETDKSPISVEEGKTVTFTATPEAGYKVKEWKADGTIVANNKTNTYTHIVTKPATITISFESNSKPPAPPTKYTVALNQTEHGTVTASPAIPADKLVDKDTVITFTAKASDGYRVGTWVISPSTAIQSGGKKGEETATIKITADTSVSVSFEAIPKHAITFSVDGANGTLKAKAEGEATETDKSPISVEEGKTVTFTATPEAGYKVKEWKADGTVVANNKTNTYTHTVTKAVEVKVSFEAIPEAAILTLDANMLTIKVNARTKDDSDIVVEGCTETTLASGMQTKLHAKGTTVTLKGNIVDLDCYNNQLTAIDVQGLTALQELVCWNNKFTVLNVSGLTALERLDCSGNQIPELSVHGLTRLRELSCGNNRLTTLDLQGLTALQTLNCHENQLTELGVQGLTSLRNLNCSYNKLTGLDVQGLTSLQVLYCYNNQLTALNVQGLNALKWLHCYGNQIKAEAMTELLKGLPTRVANDDAKAILYTGKTDIVEGNCKDYNTPPELKTAFEEAKTNKYWKLQRMEAGGNSVEI